MKSHHYTIIFYPYILYNMFNIYMPVSESLKIANNQAKRQMAIDRADYEASLITSQLVLSPDIPGYINPFADKLITNQTDKMLTDDRNIKITMEGFLDKIADPEIASYIVNKLSIEQMKILIPNWNELVVKLKRTNKKFTKDTFYNWIISYLKELNQEVSITTPAIPPMAPIAPLIPVRVPPIIPLIPPRVPPIAPIIPARPPIGLPKPLVPVSTEPKVTMKEFMTDLSKELFDRAVSDRALKVKDDVTELENEIEIRRLKERDLNKLEKDILVVKDKMKAKSDLQKKNEKERIKIEKEELRKQRLKDYIAEQEGINTGKTILGRANEKSQMFNEDKKLQLTNAEKREKTHINKMKAGEFVKYAENTYGVAFSTPKKGDGGYEKRKKNFLDNYLHDALKERFLDDKKFYVPITNGEELTTGDGIKIQLRKPIKKRIMTGRGLILDRKPIERYLQINDVHKIDMLKLNQEIPLLHCLYVVHKSKPLNKLSNVQISKDCVEVVKNIVNNKFNQKEYSLMPLEQRRIIQQFNKQCKFNLDIKDKDNEECVDKFNMCYGEFKSGNNNPELLKQLKKQVILFMNEKLISQKDGNSILLQIALS